MQDPELWARRAASFGASAAAYAQHRPDYAQAAVDWCLAGAQREVRDVLDLAAGTGKLTAGLMTAGVAVTAVEPDPQMLAELRRRLPGVPAVVGTAEAVPLADGSVDAVLVGTAWHWFDEERTLAEVRRVLRPGGVLALLYDDVDDSVPWVAGLAGPSTSSASTPGSDPEAWHPEFAGFAPSEVAAFPHTHRRTAESLTATIGTFSHTVVIDPAERAEVLARVRAYLDAQPETAHGEFDHPLVTRAARAVVAG